MQLKQRLELKKYWNFFGKNLNQGTGSVVFPNFVCHNVKLFYILFRQYISLFVWYLDVEYLVYTIYTLTHILGSSFRNGIINGLLKVGGISDFFPIL